MTHEQQVQKYVKEAAALGINVGDEFVAATLKRHSELLLNGSFIQFLFHRFLTSDLQEIYSGNPQDGFPPDILTADYCVLEGNIIAQVQDYVDVAKPIFKCALALEADSRKIKTIRPRLLKMKLTDGRRIAYAFEAGRFPLPFNVQKKDKILISGQITVRRGLMFLNSNNCRKLHSNFRATSQFEDLYSDEEVEIQEWSKPKPETHSEMVDLT